MRFSDWGVDTARDAAERGPGGPCMTEASLSIPMGGGGVEICLRLPP